MDVMLTMAMNDANDVHYDGSVFGVDAQLTVKDFERLTASRVDSQVCVCALHAVHCVVYDRVCALCAVHFVVYDVHHRWINALRNAAITYV